MKCVCVCGAGCVHDAVCVFITGALLLPACTEARAPARPQKHVCAFFPYSRLQTRVLA